MIERRGLLGTMMAAFAAGPSAAKAAVESIAPALSAPTVPVEGLLDTARDVAVSAPIRLWPRAEGPFNRMLQVLDSRLGDERDALIAARDFARAGFEPDIAANLSWSHAFKWHVQHQRCLARERTSRALTDHLYGPDY